MLAFENDYSEGAHPRILQRLLETNLEQASGYGEDPYTAAAIEKIKTACNCPQAQVRFLVGGTQTNQTVIDSVLRSYEGVIAAETGHINVHETGTIEGSGHKVCIAASRGGKVLPEGVQAVVDAHTDEHMVHPRVVYISQPTEIGTVYSLDELKALREVCDQNDLILYADGARLGSALMASEATATLADMANLCDAFYIGGTKNGLYFGEALVIVNPMLQKDFRFMIKNRGGMIAKGRLCGVMFLAALENDGYFEWARHANAMADIIRAGMEKGGVRQFIPTTTNQVFPVITREQEKMLAEKIEFEHWGDVDENRVAIRFVTSWATAKEDAQALAGIMEAL